MNKGGRPAKRRLTTPVAATDRMKVKRLLSRTTFKTYSTLLAAMQAEFSDLSKASVMTLLRVHTTKTHKLTGVFIYVEHVGSEAGLVAPASAVGSAARSVAGSAVGSGGGLGGALDGLGGGVGGLGSGPRRRCQKWRAAHSHVLFDDADNNGHALDYGQYDEVGLRSTVDSAMAGTNNSDSMADGDEFSLFKYESIERDLYYEIGGITEGQIGGITQEQISDQIDGWLKK